MITVALSTTIGAPRERVWRGLSDPAERPIWDERILGEVAVRPARHGARGAARSGARSPTARRRPPDDDRRSHKTRWRFRFGGVPQVMQEEVQSEEAGERLISRITIGSMHFDQTLTLHAEEDESGPRTRVGMKIIAHNSIAVIGEVVPRLEVQKIVIEYVDTTLRQLQKYCEADA